MVKSGGVRFPLLLGPLERSTTVPSYGDAWMYLNMIFAKTWISFLGSSPDRGRSPVEWGDFPSFRPSVHTNWETLVKQGKVTADHLMPLGNWSTI